jgi:hypothetical protein
MIVLISISIPVPSQYVILNYFFSVFKCRSPSPTLSRQICTYCAGHIYIGLSVTSRLGCSCCLAYRARQPDPARAVGCCCSLCVLFGCRLSVRLPRSVARAVLQYGEQHDLALWCKHGHAMADPPIGRDKADPPIRLMPVSNLTCIRVFLQVLTTGDPSPLLF